MKTITIYFFVLISLLLSSCKDDKRAMVVGKIQTASKLTSTEFTIDKIVHGSKTKKLLWVLKLNEARFLAYSQAIVKTGIDLSKLTEKDISIKRKRISITLPSVEVINFSYPPDKFRLDTEISDPKQFLNKISLEEQEQLFREAETEIRNNLEYMGVVKTTQDHTRSMLRSLLQSLEYEEIYIHFKSDSLIIDKIDLSKEI